MVSYKFKKFLVERKRQLTVLERMATRIGYMGAGFLVAAQWTLEPWLYIIGFICVMVQTGSRKQWNLVAVNINVMIGYTLYLINTI